MPKTRVAASSFRRVAARALDERTRRINRERRRGARARREDESKSRERLRCATTWTLPRAAPQINQCTRWVMTKEDHANKIITTTSEYMLAQRVKAAAFSSKEDYAEALIAHHALLQAAMKAKQTVDVAHCDVLDHAIADVGTMYVKHG